KEMVTEYGEIFDGHTTIKDMENEQVVFFDIEGLTSLSKEVQDTMLFTALQLIWSQALNQGRKYKTMIENGEIDEVDAKRFMFFIDECQNI
ncbi:ATP-binding protein, partial [Staphylococcus epidermidis]